MKITVAMAIALAVPMAIIVISKTLSYKIKERLSKATAFECGFTNLSRQHLPFSSQFFIVAILFLIFDIEISLIFPFPLEAKATKSTVVIITFLLILLVGLIYEWKKGGLE
jgi:NADH:ubiquinone oxidoreductase subunit 3 (subunit A)